MDGGDGPFKLTLAVESLKTSLCEAKTQDALFGWNPPFERNDGLNCEVNDLKPPLMYIFLVSFLFPRLNVIRHR